MALRLTLAGGGARQSRTLSSGTLSIGRGDRNDWVLPDPDRHLSKTHCVLSMENGQCVLTDLSTNGVSINGARTPTSRDSRTVMTDGDEFRIGDYTFTFEEAAGGGGARADAFGEETDPLAIDPLADPLGRPRDESFAHPVRHTQQAGRIGRDPFDMDDEAKHRSVVPDQDMFTGQKSDNEWKGPSQADNADANRHAMLRGRVTQPQRAPSNVDFDALIGDMSSFLGPATPAGPAGRAPYADPFGAPPAQQPAPQPYPPQPFPAQQGRPPSADPFGSFDDLMSPRPSAPPPAPPPAQPQAQPAPRSYAPPPGQGFPPDQAFATPQLAPHAPPPLPQHAPPAPMPQAAPMATPAPMQAPVPAPADANPFDSTPQSAPPPRPAPATPAAQTAPASPGSSNGAKAGLDAFLQGANATRAQTGEDPEAALRAIGQVFRILVEGLREVLMSRAAIKSEMRIEGTLIRSNNNNPLKFSFNPDEAVIALMGTERPGYMPPQRAAKEAFDDIKNHEVAVMAGVQTALRALLDRFSPDTLEGRLTQGLLTSMLPAARKSRLWDNFRELHKTIAAEAQDDFQKVFGDAFAEAYEAQSQSNGRGDAP